MTITLGVQEILSEAELNALTADESDETRALARIALRHQNAMNAITAKSREWAATIGKIQIEQILGEELDA